MPSHRAAPPPRRAQTGRRADPRHRLAPPLAVLAVFGALAIVLGTAQAGGAATKLAGRGGPAIPTHSASALAAQTAALPDVSRALRALGAHVADPDRTHRVSRSRERAPLHRWVRPGVGVLTSGFGYRWGTLHPGIDLAGPYGSPVFAATDGCIESAGYDGGYGNRILMHDWDGTDTLYGHMSAFVRTSGCVTAGTVIGREGSTGYSTGPHVHFEVHVGGVAVDPVPFLTARGVRV